MNDRKGLTITLTVIAVILTVLSVLTVVLSDSKGPKIAVDQVNLTYVNGEDKSPLLEGVSAYDVMDGDVSDTLMVKDITVLNSGNTAKVTYAARDKHNNISEAYRIVTYIDSSENYSSADDEETLEEETVESIEESIENTDEGITEPTEIEVIPEEEESEEPESQPEDEAPAEEKKETSKPETPKKAETPNQEDKTPKITLKQKSVNIDVGQTFNPSDYIKTKENASSISIDGAINVMAPGTYPLTFKVTGPDGKTASETLTVVVK